MTDAVRRAIVTIGVLMSSRAVAQPVEPTRVDPAPVAPTVAPDPTTAPCGVTSDAEASSFSYVCSTQRLHSSRMLASYRSFTELAPRDGYTIGVRAISTLTTVHRRDGVELGLGLVVDRIAQLRIMGGPVRAVNDGVADVGGEVGIAFIRMGPRWQLGLQVNSVFAVRFRDGSFSLGAAVLAGYELVSTDWFALTVAGRVGVDAFNERLPNGELDTATAPFISLALAVDLYRTYN